MGPSEVWLARTFLGLLDPLGAGAEPSAWSEAVVERCAELLEGAEVVLNLVGASGLLALSAASSEAARLVELVELESAEGPGNDAFGTQAVACNVRLDAEGAAWPRFAATARSAGFAVAHAFPMGRYRQVLGVLVALERSADLRSAHDLEVAQVLVEAAAVALLKERSLHDEQVHAVQLQAALDSRVAIEQAKGFLSARLGVGVGDAFSLLRFYARSQARPLEEAARGVVDGTVAPGTLLAAARRYARRRCPPAPRHGDDLRP